MTANELRIGNSLEFEGKECIVKEIDASGVVVLFEDGEEVWIDLFQLQPILITEARLLKFGFMKTKENFSTYDFGNLSIYMPSVYYEKGRTYFNSWVIIEKSPETVHQLQNLYFGLKGEELKQKDETQ